MSAAVGIRFHSVLQHFSESLQRLIINDTSLSRTFYCCQRSRYCGNDQYRHTHSFDFGVPATRSRLRLLGQPSDPEQYLAFSTNMPRSGTVVLYTLLFSTLVVLPEVAADPISIAVPPSPPSTHAVQPNFLGISLELSFMDEYCQFIPFFWFYWCSVFFKLATIPQVYPLPSSTTLRLCARVSAANLSVLG